MNYFPSKYLIAAIIIHGCIGIFEDIIGQLFVRAPVPLGNFYNESLILHYGITLDSDSLAQAMSIINSLQKIGTILSIFIILPKMDSLGRKFVSVYFRVGLAFLIIIFMLGGKLFLSVESFAIGTILLGASFPIKGGVTKYYISESSPDEIRGFLTQSLTSIPAIIHIGLGTLLLPQFLGNDDKWHFTFYIAIANILVFLAGAVFLPESPKFLWYQGKRQEAIKAVKTFHGKDADIESITHGYDLERSVIHTNSNHITFMQIWRNDALRSSLILTLITMFVTVIGPEHIYNLYSITLKNKFGFTNSQSVSLELLLNTIFLPISYILPFLYEKIGRRPIFLAVVFISFLTGICMFLSEAIFEFNGSNSNSATFILAFLWTFLSEFSFSLGSKSFSFVLIADLLPAPAKAATTQALMLLTSLLGISFNFLFSFFQPILGFAYYFPIIFMQIFFFFYLYRNLPETRGKAIYQNFEELQSRSASRRSTFLIPKSRSSSTHNNNYGTV